MPKIHLVLHNIRSTYNVGSIFRTADGLGVDEIIISGYTPYPNVNNDPRLPHESLKVSKQIAKTALGAESSVKFRLEDDLVSWLQASRLPIVALEQAPNSVLLKNYHPPQELVLILGEEVEGIPAELLQLANTILEIPMVGRKESFNVSVATAIALYELKR